METMTDLWQALCGDRRAECWGLFKKLSAALVYEKRGVLSEHAGELKRFGAEFNKACGKEHFNISAPDEIFLSALIEELEVIKNRSRLCD